MSKTHDLKCHPEPFRALMDGTKTGEFRLNDRNYEVGDILHQREWSPDCNVVCGVAVEARAYYTGRSIDHLVTHIVKGPAFGIPDRYCMMSLQPIHPDNVAAGYIPIKADVLRRTMRNLETIRGILWSESRRNADVRDAHSWTVNVIEELKPFAPKEVERP